MGTSAMIRYIIGFLLFLCGTGLGFLLVMKIGTFRRKRKTAKNPRVVMKKERKKEERRQKRSNDKVHAFCRQSKRYIVERVTGVKYKISGSLRKLRARRSESDDRPREKSSLIERQIGKRSDLDSWTALNSSLDDKDEGEVISKLQKGEDRAYRTFARMKKKGA